MTKILKLRVNHFVVMCFISFVSAQEAPQYSVFSDIATVMESVRVEAQIAHSAKIESLAYSPDGLYLASSSDDHTVKIWDTLSWRVYKTLFLHAAAVTAADFDASGSRIVSADADGLIIVRRTSDWKKIAEFRHGAEATAVRFSGGGKKIVSGGSDGMIRVWDLESRAPVFVIGAHTQPVEKIVFAKGGSVFASCSLDGSVRVWSLEAGRILRVLNLAGGVKSIAISNNGKFLAAGGSAKTLTIWNIKTGEKLFSMDNIPHEILSLDFSADDTALAIGLNTNQFAMWDYAAGEMFLYNAHQNGYITSVVFSPNNKHFACASNDASIRIWNINDSRSECVLHAENIRLDANSVNTFFSGGSEFAQKDLIWTALSKTLQYDFSPNGMYRVEGEGTTDVVMRNVKTGELIERLYSHVKPIVFARFSASGKYVVSAAKDDTVKIWSMETKTLSYTIAGIGIISKAVFAADDTKLITLSYDGTVRIWDAASGKLLLIFVAYSNNDWLCITPDGYYNSSARGELYLNLVADGKSIPYPYSTVEDFRSLLFDPRVINKRLSMQ